MVMLTICYPEDRSRWHLFKDEASAMQKLGQLVKVSDKHYNECENKDDEKAWHEMYDADIVCLSRLVFNGKEYVERNFLSYNPYANVFYSEKEMVDVSQILHAN